MSKKTIRGAALSICLVLPFVAGSTAYSDTDHKALAEEIAAGKVLAEKLCARCHAVSTTGDSPEVKAPPFRTFAQKWPVESLEEALAEGIVVGHHVMPEFEFEPVQITNLLSYIGSLSVEKPAKSDQAD